MRKALYIGSFDPLTLGHLDIIERATRMFDSVLVAVGENPKKKCMFSVEERITMVTQAIRTLPNVCVAPQGVKSLAADYAHMNGCQFLIKGARTVQDFDYERLIHEVTLTQQRNLETVLLFSSSALSHVSSSAVKELANFHGLIHHYVPLSVKAAIEHKNEQVIIGVTGVIGSGKSTLCRQLANTTGSMPIHHIDMDTLSHQLLADTTMPLALDVQAQVRAVFGTLDRKEIGKVVFADSDEGRSKLALLNAILQDPILTLLRMRLADLRGVILLEGALLAESNWLFLCNNRVILVETPPAAIHTERLLGRGMHLEQISRRIASQLNQAEKRKQIQTAIDHYGFGEIVTFDSASELPLQSSAAFLYVQPSTWFLPSP